MKTDNEILEYAYLMDKTGYAYIQIYQYIKTQEYYFSFLDDEESVNEENMFDFLYNQTNLNKEQVDTIGKFQLTFLKDTISKEEEYRMVKKMVNSFTKEDKEYMNEDFYLLAIDYEIFYSL